MSHHDHHSDDEGFAIDPVCGMSVDPANAAATRELDGVTYYFCSGGCADRFDGDPQRFIAAN